MTKSASTEVETFLTVKEAAQRRKLSEKTIYRAIESGDLSAHRFGRAIRLSESNLARYDKQRQT